MSPSDKVIIKDLLVQGIIGIHPRERQAPQPIRINLELYSDFHHAGETDDISNCLDYSLVVERVRTWAETAHRFTVEALAEDIARLCLEDKRVLQVMVRVEKLEAIQATTAVGVEIVRRQG